MSDEATREVLKMVTDAIKGTHPAGTLGPGDKGATGLVVGVTKSSDGKHRVFMEFGEELTWMAFEPAQAAALSASLKEYADRAEEEDAKAI